MSVHKLYYLVDRFGRIQPPSFLGPIIKAIRHRLGFAARDPEVAVERWAKPERIEQVDEELNIVVPVRINRRSATVTYR